MESAKKRTLTHDSEHFFQFFYCYGHFYPFWASWGLLGGPLGALALMWGPFRALISGFTSIAILIPGLVQPPVQLGKFADFGVCQNNSAKAKADGGWHQSKNEKVSKYFCLIACLKRGEISKSI